jgi:outer membrane receptor protein involved in Fe transport
VAGELEAPVLKDLPLVELFSINAAARYTAYSISGDYTTWKVGADWQVADSFRLRGATSRDIRAPTLNDLYAPQTVTQVQFQDLLTGLAPLVPQYSGGNPKLRAEIGQTTTLGLVWTPAPGVSLSLDHYQIAVNHALTTVRGDAAVYQQACYASQGASPVCQLQTRPIDYVNKTAANAVTAWYNVNSNISQATTRGYDFEFNVATDLFGRPFTARWLLNYQPVLQYVDTIAGTTIYSAGIAYNTGSRYAAPKWSSTLLLHYQALDELGIDLAERWRNALTMQADPSQVWINPRVPPFYTTNVTLTYTVTTEPGPVDIFLNVQNLFDKSPPPAAYYNSPSPGQYGWAVGDDPMGRYFTLGVRARL